MDKSKLKFYSFISLYFAILLTFNECQNENIRRFRIRTYGEPCSLNRQCLRGLFCISRICECPNDRIWNNRRCMRCPTEWVKYQNDCFLISNQKMNWLDASNYCQSRNGQLMTIDTNSILDFSLNFIQNYNLTGNYYIGARAHRLPSNWTWTNGDRIPSSGLMWSECGSPTNTGGNGIKIAEGCASINKFGLDDLNCESTEKFICSLNRNEDLYRINNFQSRQQNVNNNNTTLSEYLKKCNFNYQCRYGLKCVNFQCACEQNSIFLTSSKKCISSNSTLQSSFRPIINQNQQSSFIIDKKFKWIDGEVWSKNNSLSLFNLKDPANLFSLLDYLKKNNLDETYWIGAISKDSLDYWSDEEIIEEKSW
ncbi:unnamed protein product [Brachionus calyciflorus]|uniref:C-type lectin domain-containing protein n=1 Tax=Brachionus calyciflorus TaxID=104777 RepID=A0A813T0P2_9BILA|nr:unnamed protein product [Brachionus calyciflorus]